MNRLSLLIDAGNTRIKWGWWDGQAWLEKGAAATADAAWPFGCDRRTPAVIALSHVAGPAVATRIHAALPFAPQVLRPQAQGLGLVLDYDAGLLGADRYAALLACRDLAPCLVVSAGTAVTVDALLREGSLCRHLGGLILPGRRTRVAPGLAAVPEGRVCADWPRNTADALETGRALALRGAIEALRARLAAAAGGEVPLILGGGDADWLRPQIEGAVRVRDNLVLEGLRNWLEELD